MKRLHYLLLLLVGLLASCSLSFDSLVDEPTADDDGIENNGDGFTAPRHVKSSTLNAQYQFNEDVIWLNHDNYKGYIAEIKDSLVSFSTSMPKELLPQTGEVVYHAADSLFAGIAIEAERVFKEGDQYKCIGKSVGTKRVFKVLKFDLRTRLPDESLAKQYLTRGRPSGTPVLDKTFKIGYAADSKNLPPITTPYVWTGNFKKNHEFKARLRVYCDAHYDDSGDGIDFWLKKDYVVTLEQTINLSGTGTLNTSLLGPFSVERPPCIPIPSMSVDIIPLVLSIGSSFQLESEMGFDHIDRTWTDKGELIFGMEVGKRSYETLPYLKFRDSQFTTSSTDTHTGKRTFDKVNFTFGLNLSFVSAFGVSLFDGGLGATVSVEDAFAENFKCSKREWQNPNSIKLPYSFYEFTAGNDVTKRSVGLEIFKVQNVAIVTSMFNAYGINDKVPTVVKLIPGVGSVFGNISLLKDKLPTKTEYYFPTIKEMSVAPVSSGTSNATRFEGHVVFQRAGREKIEPNHFSDLCLLIRKGTAIVKMVNLAPGMNLEKNKKYPIKFDVENFDESEDWSALVTVVEHDKKRMLEVEEYKLYKPEEGARVKKLTQYMGREKYEYYEYGFMTEWEYSGPENYYRKGMRVKLYDEWGKLLTTRYFASAHDKPYMFVATYFECNLPMKFTVEVAAGIYEDFMSTNKDFDKTVNPKYVKRLQLTPDFGYDAVAEEFSDMVYRIGDYMDSED